MTISINNYKMTKNKPPNTMSVHSIGLYPFSTTDPIVHSLTLTHQLAHGENCYMGYPRGQF